MVIVRKFLDIIGVRHYRLERKLLTCIKCKDHLNSLVEFQDSFLVLKNNIFLSSILFRELASGPKFQIEPNANQSKY